MHKTKLTSMALLLALAGCGGESTTPITPDSSVTDTGVGTDGGSDAATDGAAPDTGGPLPMALDCGDCVFVAGTLAIPAVNGEMTEGFNLDNVVSTGETRTCSDRADSVDAAGNTGIDNALASIASVTRQTESLNTNLAEAIADGSAILLLDLDGVESTEDNDVTVTLLIGTIKPPSACTVEGTECGRGYTCAMTEGDSNGTCQMVTSCTMPIDCPAFHNCTDMACVPSIANAQGMVASGQTFPIEAASYTNMDPTMMPLVRATGRISRGRLDVSGLNVELNFETAGQMVTLNLREGRIAADLTATGLENGRLGGELAVNQLNAIATAIGGMNAGTIIALLPDVSDIDPSQADPTKCETMSAGFTFTAVPAMRGSVVRTTDPAPVRN